MSNFKDTSVVLKGMKKLIDKHAQYRYKRLDYLWNTSSLKGASNEVLRQAEHCLSAFISATTKHQKHIDHDETKKNKGNINDEKPIKPQPINSQSNNIEDRKHFHTATNINRSFMVKRFYSKDSHNNKKKSIPLADSKAKPEISQSAKESQVPGTRVQRLIGFGGLGLSLAFDTVSNKALTGLGLKEKKKGDAILDDSIILSDSNAEKIVATLCRMRGAALKLGQMLSIQDSSLISPSLAKIFERVRQSADFMPVSQMKEVMGKELGRDWEGKFEEFDEKPFAAASIGQVHRGVLKDGKVVAVKIQYPGVSSSITSDINNLVTLLKFSNVLPEGLYAASALKTAKRELAWECDYLREAKASQKFRSLIKDHDFLYVPEVIQDLTTKQVLTTEMVRGVPLDELEDKDEALRNKVCQTILELCLQELFSFRFMQTDPNWSNFLYDDVTNKISLLDFGASRGFERRFTDPYLELIMAASKGDRETVLLKSKEMKFLTGFENKVMTDAHVDAVMILGEAFASKSSFDFGHQSTAKRIHELIPVMLKHRLTPPPEETYSLHRKMAGCFLICSKLGANLNCRPMFLKIYEEYNADKAKK